MRVMANGSKRFGQGEPVSLNWEGIGVLVRAATLGVIAEQFASFVEAAPPSGQGECQSDDPGE